MAQSPTLPPDLPIHSSDVPMPSFTVMLFGMTKVTHRPDRPMIRPCWRFYWNPERGGAVEHAGNRSFLEREHVLIIPPHTAIQHILLAPHRHFFVHALAGHPYDSCSDTVFRVALLPGEPQRILDFAASAGRNPTTPSASRTRRLSARDNLTLTSLLSRWLSALPATTWPSPPRDARVVRILHEMEHLNDPTMDNETLAQAVSMSRNAFVRLFRSQLGVPPQTFLQQRRLTRACLLLQYSDKSIEMIADECGICDRSYLSRLFKRAYGVGPATYRRTARKGS